MEVESGTSEMGDVNRFPRFCLRFLGVIQILFGGTGLVAYRATLVTVHAPSGPWARYFWHIFLVMSLVSIACYIMLIVLGVQTISIGLIGEMIIFTHSRETRDYSILEVLE